jgi:AbrB family looped-hinge helix DNA binding protein
MSVEVLTVSSKGQVVLPASMRRKLSISSGSKLAAYAAGDVIVLKVIELPPESDFKSMLDEAEQWAREAGYTEDDIAEVIKSVRDRRRA